MALIAKLRTGRESPRVKFEFLPIWAPEEQVSCSECRKMAVNTWIYFATAAQRVGLLRHAIARLTNERGDAGVRRPGLVIGAYDLSLVNWMGWYLDHLHHRARNREGHPGARAHVENQRLPEWLRRAVTSKPVLEALQSRTNSDHRWRMRQFAAAKHAVAVVIGVSPRSFDQLLRKWVRDNGAVYFLDVLEGRAAWPGSTTLPVSLGVLFASDAAAAGVCAK